MVGIPRILSTHQCKTSLTHWQKPRDSENRSMIHDGERRNSGQGHSEAAKRSFGVAVLSSLAARPGTTNVWTMAQKGSEKIEGNMALLKGQFSVDVSLFFFRKPPKPLSSKFHHFQPRSLKFPQDQTRIQASSDEGGDFGYVLYPLRRGTDKEPAVRELKNGVVEIKWDDQKRHLIFLFPESTKVEAAGIQFEGRAGVLKLDQGGRRWLELEDG